MLKSLTLENHECHRLTELEFSPGLNVFIGETDAGKSSVFRAAYWGFFNRPLGNQMLPLFWKGETKVTFEFIDPEHTVSRIKGKKVNDYQLNDSKPINAGSGAPPEEITQAILMDEVNFQTQVDRSFMMFESSGERGRILNRIAGLEEIDKALDNARRDVSKLAKEHQTGRAAIEEQEEQLKVFDNLEELEEKVSLCEQFVVYIQKSEKKITTLNNLIKEEEEVQTKLIKVDKFLQAEKKLKRVESLLQEIQEKEERAQELNNICLGIERIDRKLEKFPNFSEVEKVLEDINKIGKQIEQATEKAVDLRTQTRKLSRIETKIKDLELEIEELEDSLPEVCDSCGAGINENTMEM